MSYNQIVSQILNKFLNDSRPTTNADLKLFPRIRQYYQLRIFLLLFGPKIELKRSPQRNKYGNS